MLREITVGHPIVREQVHMTLAPRLGVARYSLETLGETTDRVDISVNGDFGTVCGNFEGERALRHDVTPNYK